MEKNQPYAALPTVEAALVPNVEVEAKKLSVQVTAPSDLQEGFSLSVQVDGKDAVVTVPRGGVSAGESFVGPVSFLDGSSSTGDEAKGSAGIPVGSWRYGLCDCCRFGFFHPLWVMSSCCSCFGCGLLALAQVQSRLNLTVFGKERTDPHGASAFRKAFLIFAVWLVSTRLLVLIFHLLAPDVPAVTYQSAYVERAGSHAHEALRSAGALDKFNSLVTLAFMVFLVVYYQGFLDHPKNFGWIIVTLFLFSFGIGVIGFFIGVWGGLQDGLEAGSQGQIIQETTIIPVPPGARFVGFLDQILAWSLPIFIIYVGFKTRSLIRQKYAIPGDDCEDCCIMTFCACCSIAQMSSHTADYHNHGMDYGAEDGLQQQV